MPPPFQVAFVLSNKTAKINTDFKPMEDRPAYATLSFYL